MKKENISYIFEGENGENSPNYLCRVRTGGGGFVNAINTPIEILDEDVLIKVPGDGPWFALFREEATVATPGEEAGETAAPETEAPEKTSDARTPEEIEADAKAAEEKEANRLKTLEQDGKPPVADGDPTQGNPAA